MILFTILPLVNAQLIADYTGDVIHFYVEDNEIIIEIDDRPNVDITEIGYEIVENQLFIKMCVVGEIILEENFSYVVIFGPHILGYDLISLVIIMVRFITVQRLLNMI
jgi:hypothetical protein